MKRRLVSGLIFRLMGLAFYVGKTTIWVRRGKHAWALDRGPLLFSERNGYRKYHSLLFGWRFTKRTFDWVA